MTYLYDSISNLTEKYALNSVKWF